jgi:hypothetical protein
MRKHGIVIGAVRRDAPQSLQLGGNPIGERHVTTKGGRLRVAPARPGRDEPAAAGAQVSRNTARVSDLRRVWTGTTGAAVGHNRHRFIESFCGAQVLAQT